MSTFAYLSVLVSIIVGLGITQILTGIGHTVQQWHTAPPDWIHLVWCANTLLYLIVNWWIALRWYPRTEYQLWLFLFILSYPATLFL